MMGTDGSSRACYDPSESTKYVIARALEHHSD